MPTANVYIDGFNLYYGCIKGTSHKWLDLEALAQGLLPKNTINRVRYFTARVSARPGDAGAPQRQQAYLRALATNPRVSIHYGQFLTHPTRMRLANPPASGSAFAEVIKTEEKGSDVNMASWLLLDSFRQDSDVVLLITNDSDLTEPVRMARHELGRVVGVANPHSGRASRQLCADATFVRQVRSGLLAASHLPPALTDSQGRTITKPTSW